MTPETLKELTVSMPQPPGWAVVKDQSQPSFEVLRKTGVQAFPPTAMLMVFKLVGNFDTAEATKHGYADAELTEGFTKLNASMDNFRGFPSAMIEGSYTADNQRLHRYNRLVIANGKAPLNQRYLVQFSVTTASDQARDQAAEVQAIIAGFTVATK